MLTKSQFKTRYEALKAMNTLMCLMNDETAYYDHWIYLIPDQCDDEELMDIACDEDMEDVFEDACGCFTRCVKHYASRSGFCIPSFDDGLGYKAYGTDYKQSSDDDEDE